MWVFSSVWVIIPSTKFFLGSFFYCLFVSLFIYYFLNNGGWHAFWAGFGDDYQSTLFVSNDHSVCNFPTCPSNGLRNHNFKVVASGYQCIKGQVFGFPALCLSNFKIVNQLITKKRKKEKKKNEKWNGKDVIRLSVLSLGLNLTLQGTEYQVQCGKGAPVTHTYSWSFCKYLMHLFFLICSLIFFCMSIKSWWFYYLT